MLDTGKQRSLRQMKVVSFGFLMLATLIYALSSWLGGGGWIGYLRAAAEAGMVGGLADWFAVTALFRRPLGLPIPHTAIIPTRKNALGESLGEFVGTNFLAESVVRDKLRNANIAKRVGSWLAKQDNAQRITHELIAMAKGVVTILRDDDVQTVIEQAVVRKLTAIPIGPPLGKLLASVFADRTHHKLVDLICDRAYEWVRDNHAVVKRIVADHAPAWSPRFIGDLLAGKVYQEVLSFSWAVKTNSNHPMRLAIDRFLAEFAEDLQHDPETGERAERIKQQILTHPEVRNFIGSAWLTAKSMLLNAMEDPSSELQAAITRGVKSLGEKLRDEQETQDKVTTWLESVATYVITRYRNEITGLISDTVARWDAEETSRKIELQVGRDLQFIRINGTVVGALAGLAIYGITQLFS